MNEPTVARFHEHETSPCRTVLVARVASDIPAGAYVALVDVRGQLFLHVLEKDDAKFLSAKELAERSNRK